MRSRDRLTAVAGLAALVVAVLAVGGAVWWAIIAVAGLAIVAAAAQLTSRRRFERVSPLVVVLGLAVGLTAVQLIPLPEAVLSRLNPVGHELIADGAALLGDEPRDAWRPLSVEPPATRLELAKLLTYLLLAWVALRIAATDHGRQRLISGVAGTAGAVAVLALAHELVGATALYGLYRPAHAAPIVMAPLLNANHLACFMALGALCAAGLALHERRVPAYRVLWLGVALACVLVVLATRSRGGVLALGAGALVTAVIVVLQRLRASHERRRGDMLRVVVPATVSVLCALVLVVFLGGDETRSELEETRLEELSDPRSKFAAWEAALILVEEAPILGIGRGAFEPAFTRVNPASAQLTFSHVENEYLQIAVDWGVAGALLLGGALVLAAIAIARRWRTGTLAAGAIGGLTAVAVQSTVDFALELPGLAVPTVAVAATLLSVSLRETSRRRRVVVTRSALLAAVAIAAVIAATPLARSVSEEHAILREGRGDLAAARAALARHPLDYVAAAAVAHRSTEPRARVAFINHALRLNPRHPALHRTVATWLVAAKRFDQAALEYRLALAGTTNPDPLLLEALAALPDPATVVGALPTEPRLWSRLVDALIRAKRHDLALAYLVAYADQVPDPSLATWRRMFALAEQQGALEPALRAARALAGVEGGPAITLRVARLHVQAGQYDAAIALLQPLVSTATNPRERIDASFQLCEIHVARPDWGAARDCFIAVLQMPSLSVDQRRRVHGQLATIEDALGNKQRAELERRLSRELGAPRSPPPPTPP